MIRLYLFLITVILLSGNVELSAQVTIGSGTPPNKGALLDLKEEAETSGNANSTKGLLLPRLNLASLKITDESADLKSTIENTPTGEKWDPLAHAGLTVYHLAENDVACEGVFVWTGSEWDKLGTPCPAIKLACGSLKELFVIQNTPVNAAVNINYEYERTTGEDVVLTDGTVLGEEQGLKVVVNGNQTLSAKDLKKILKLKLTGTAPDAITTIELPFYLPDPNSGTGCLLKIRVQRDPTQMPVGDGTLIGKVCFDINLSNYEGDCGSKASRDGNSTDFYTVGPQIYTYTSGSGAKKDLYFVAYEWMDDKLASGMLVDSWTGGKDGAIINGEKVNMSLEYQKNLSDTDGPIFGRTRAQAAKVKIYAIYTGADNQQYAVELVAGIMDCFCCPGYLALKGGYSPEAGTLSINVSIGSTVKIDEVKKHFTANGKDVCFYKKNAPNGMDYRYQAAIQTCSSGTGVDTEHKNIGWRLPNLMELAAISNVDIVNNVNSSKDTEGMKTWAYWSVNKAPGSQNTGSLGYAWFWSYNDQGWAEFNVEQGDNFVRCVKTLEPMK